MQPGPGAGRGGARPGGGAGRRGRRGQVAPGLRVCPLAPHPGLAGAGERLGVLRQGHPLLPGHRPAQALCPRRGARRHPHHPRQGDRAGADARRDPPGYHPGAARTPGRPAGRQPVSAARSRRSAASAPSTALKRVLLRESQVQPLLLVFEDLHWIDTETQALLDSLVESLPTAQLLLLVNYRPEYQHGWGSKTYYTQLRLDPLPPLSADEFLQALLGDDASLAAAQPTARLRAPRAIPSSWRRACAPWWRPGYWWASAGPTVWRKPCRPCRCQPRCRRCWQRVSTGCHPRRSASCRRLP